MSSPVTAVCQTRDKQDCGKNSGGSSFLLSSMLLLTLAVWLDADVVAGISFDIMTEFVFWQLFGEILNDIQVLLRAFLRPLALQIPSNSPSLLAGIMGCIVNICVSASRCMRVFVRASLSSPRRTRRTATWSRWTSTSFPRPPSRLPLPLPPSLALALSFRDRLPGRALVKTRIDARAPTHTPTRSHTRVRAHTNTHIKT